MRARIDNTIEEDSEWVLELTSIFPQNRELLGLEFIYTHGLILPRKESTRKEKGVCCSPRVHSSSEIKTQMSLPPCLHPHAHCPQKAHSRLSISTKTKE